MSNLIGMLIGILIGSLVLYFAGIAGADIFINATAPLMYGATGHYVLGLLFKG